MANRLPKSVAINYKLPSLVESIQRGWILSCQTSLLTSASLAVLSAILLLFFENKIGGSHSLEILGYASLFLNISACTSAFILIDRLGNISWRAAEVDKPFLEGKVTSTQQNVLKMYGIGALWPWLVWHWLLCFALGSCSIFGQVLLYIWKEKSTEIKIAATTLAVFSFLPLLALILAPAVQMLIVLNRPGYEDSVKSPVLSDIESATRPISIATDRLRKQSIRTNPPHTPTRVSFPSNFPSYPAKFET